MLKVTVELLPHGNESAAEVLGVMEIINTGDNPLAPAKGNYLILRSHHPQRSILHWDRDRGFWELVAEALKEAQGGSR